MQPQKNNGHETLAKFFVHRNIANLVNTLDMSSTAVIQYAVQHLKGKNTLLCVAIMVAVV